jgi:PBP1b-binding outer membrane lipoprotein LpoB
MKKLIALLMVSAFAFAFVACGGGSKPEATEESTPATETPAEPAAPADSADSSNQM